MKVVEARPPNYDEIRRVFPMASAKGVIFTFGQTIYNPSGVEIPPELMSHESVHAQRQGASLDGVMTWWGRYLAEPQFRIEEELLAHRAEYRAFKGMVKDRKLVAQKLEIIAARMSGPLYNNAMTLALAKHLILAEVYQNKVAKIRREHEGAAA